MWIRLYSRKQVVIKLKIFKTTKEFIATHHEKGRAKGRWYAAASHATQDLTYNPPSLRCILGLVTVMGPWPRTGTESSVTACYFLSVLGALRSSWLADSSSVSCTEGLGAEEKLWHCLRKRKERTYDELWKCCRVL